MHTLNGLFSKTSTFRVKNIIQGFNFLIFIALCVVFTVYNAEMVVKSLRLTSSTNTSSTSNTTNVSNIVNKTNANANKVQKTQKAQTIINLNGLMAFNLRRGNIYIPLDKNNHHKFSVTCNGQTVELIKGVKNEGFNASMENNLTIKLISNNKDNASVDNINNNINKTNFKVDNSSLDKLLNFNRIAGIPSTINLEGLIDYNKIERIISFEIPSSAKTTIAPLYDNEVSPSNLFQLIDYTSNQPIEEYYTEVHVSIKIETEVSMESSGENSDNDKQVLLIGNRKIQGDNIVVDINNSPDLSNHSHNDSRNNNHHNHNNNQSFNHFLIYYEMFNLEKVKHRKVYLMEVPKSEAPKSSHLVDKASFLVPRPFICSPVVFN